MNAVQDLKDKGIRGDQGEIIHLMPLEEMMELVNKIKSEIKEQLGGWMGHKLGKDIYFLEYGIEKEEIYDAYTMEVLG